MFFLLAVCACDPLEVRPLEPTPQWLKVYLSPAWQPLSASVAACIPSGSALVYLDNPDQADAALVWGDDLASDQDAFQLGYEEWAVVVHPDNPVQSISSEGLRLVTTGEIRDWDFLGQAPQPLSAWGYPPGSELARVFRDAGLADGPPVQTAPGPIELRSAVAADPAAIGLLPRRWLDSTVRELPIPDLDPESMRFPLLALTPAEPQGALRAWLFCLQERLAE